MSPGFRGSAGWKLGNALGKHTRPFAVKKWFMDPSGTSQQRRKQALAGQSVISQKFLEINRGPHYGVCTKSGDVIGSHVATSYFPFYPSRKCHVSHSILYVWPGPTIPRNIATFALCM